MIIAQKQEFGLAKPTGRPRKEIGLKNNPISKTPTLEEMGIDKNLANRARKLASHTSEDFEGAINEHKDDIAAANAKLVDKIEKPSSVNSAGMEILNAKKSEAKAVEAEMLAAFGIDESPVPEHEAPEDDDGKTVAKWRYEKLRQDYHRQKSLAEMWEREASNLKPRLEEARTQADLLDSENQNLVERTSEYEDLKAVFDADDRLAAAAATIKAQEVKIRRLEARIESMQYDGSVLARELEWRRKKMRTEEKKSGKNHIEDPFPMQGDGYVP